MLRNAFKWVSRCLGWIALASLALAAVCAYVADKHVGYGTVEIRLTWRDKSYSPNRLAPDPVNLRIGGKQRDWEPGNTLSLRPGLAPLDLLVKDFRACSTVVKVAKNTLTVAEFNLEAEPRSITVGNLKSNTIVNGERCDGRWVLRNAEVGRAYRIEASVPGYHTNTVCVQIDNPGQDLVTNLTWIPLTGFVRVNITPPASDLSVSINGAAIDPIVGGEVAVGVHSLSVASSDYYPYSQRIEVLLGITNDYQVTLKPRPALLTLEVVRPQALWEVRDSSGAPIQLQDGVAELAPGTNSITIGAKGYLSQQRDFLTKPNGKYKWRVELEREGSQAYQKKRAEFLALQAGANMALLESRGGLTWRTIRQTSFDDTDLVRGAEQYEKATEDVCTILENIKLAEQFKGQFKLLVNEGWTNGALGKFGGIEWQRIRSINFDTEDATHEAKQYKEALENLKEILKTMPERGRVWTNEVRSSNSIDYWTLMNDFAKAKRELASYAEYYGPGSDFERWFGGSAEKIQSWREKIEAKERYAPRAYVPDGAARKKKR